MRHLLFAILCFFSLCLSAQSVFMPNTFEKGKEFFQQENYVSASQMLKKLSPSSLTNSLYKEELEYMLACSAYELKESDCIALLRHFIDTYPQSVYSNRIYALMASTCFFEKKYGEAIALFGNCKLMLLSDKERDASTFRLASSYLEVGNLKESSVWFRILQESDGLYRSDALYNLSYIDYLQGQYDSSLSGFLSLQDDKIYAEIVPYYIAEIYLLKKNYDKSKIVAQNYLSTFPQSKNSIMMQRILGESEYGLKQYPEAIEALDDYANSTASTQKNIMYQLGMSYYHIRAFSKAAYFLEKTTDSKDALSQNSYLHMGLAYLQLKDKNKARMAFSQAASSDFDLQIKEQALYNYALCVHETAYSPFDESVKIFERYLNEFPDSRYSEEVSDYLIDVYMNTRSYEAALKSIAKIAHPTPRILEAKQRILFRLGTQAFVNGRFQETINYLDRSLELARYDRQTKADAYYWLGEAFFKLNQFAQAKKDFLFYLDETSKKENEMYALAHYNLGYTDFKQKNYTSALHWFLKYLQLDHIEKTKMRADAYNRAADCYFFARRFSDAHNYYVKSTETDSSFGDYSLFQAALVLGLQKDYSGKVRLLDELLNKYSQSQYMADAFYEKGRAYVQMEDNVHAIGAFDKLLTEFPESPVARKGANEIGLLYYQDDDYVNAIQAYKKVMISYPGSDESLLAQRDLKSIYLDLNKIDEYANFISKIPGSFGLDRNEKDSLTYVAAERLYMRGDLNASRKSFEKYLQEFPKGVFSINSHYYIGLMNYHNKENEKALLHFEKVMEFPNNKFSQDAMTMSANLFFDLKQYVEALVLYKQLKEKTSSIEKKQMIKIGILRSANLSKNIQETIWAASDLLADSKLSPELENEARFYRAKAYLNQNVQKNAILDLKELSKDTRNTYGAESKYLLAQQYFDSGETMLAEKEILDYIDKSTPHAYWLARSFVLLSDVYVKMGKKTDAKQYLISLQENYQANDDISDMIKNRLKKLNK